MNIAVFVIASLGVCALLVALLAHSLGYESPAPSLEVPRAPLVRALVIVGIGLLGMAAWLAWGVR